MKGLILKDIINLKKNIKIFGISLVFYIVFAFSMGDSSFVSTMLTLVFAMLTLTTYSIDDFAKWDSYALTMPIKKEDIVRGKYLVMLLLAAASFLINDIILLILNYIMKKENIFDGISIAAGGAAVVIMFYGIIIPFVTKLGVEKARIIILAIYMTPFLLGTIIFRELKKLYPEPPASLVSIGKVLMDNIYILVPLALVIILFVSYLISVRIYKNKEF